RRHTRWPRDWSSDVCSSDLAERPRSTTTLPAARRTAGPIGLDIRFEVPPSGGGGNLDRAGTVRAAATKTMGTRPKKTSRQLMWRSEERRVGKEWRCGGAGAE